MKKLTWIGVIILALVLLIGGTIGVGRAIFTNRYEAEIAAMKAKGEPLTPKDLTGKRVSPPDDAAVLYHRIHQMRTASNLKQDARVTDKVYGLRGASMDATTRQSLAQALTHLQPLIDLTEEAVSKPRFQVRIDWSRGSPDFEPLTEMRNMCRIISTRGVLRAQTGDMAGAADDVAMQFRIAAQPHGGSVLISHLVRVAVTTIAAQSVISAARYGEFTEAQARQIYEVTEKVDLSQSLRQAWLGERVLFLYLTEPGRIGGIAGIMVAPGGLPPGPGRIAAAPLDAFYYRIAFRGDRATYLRLIAAQLDGVQLSYREAFARGFMNDSMQLPLYASLSKTLAPVFARASFMRFRAEEELARAQVFLALQAYRDRYGGYPASMKELRAGLRWKLPMDPFSGKNFIYKRQRTGFILYSVGPDMKDDGGRAVSNDDVHLDSKGDIVLRWGR